MSENVNRWKEINWILIQISDDLLMIYNEADYHIV